MCVFSAVGMVNMWNVSVVSVYDIVSYYLRWTIPQKVSLNKISTETKSDTLYPDKIYETDKKFCLSGTDNVMRLQII